MVKKTKSTKVKSTKNKNKNNIHIKINIDQSKKTTGGGGGQPRKSNIRTLPAYSAIPSGGGGGGNYVRQFTQDPYYSQSQYEHMNLIKQYNNLIKQNQTNGFKDVNQNDQQLIKDMNNQTVRKSYKVDEVFSPEMDNFDGDESLTARMIDFEMNDDPETNGLPQNKLLINDVSPTLPLNDLNDRQELIEYDKQPPQPQPEQKELLQIENVPEPPKQLEYEFKDPIKKAMHYNEQYLNGYKVFYDKDIPPNQVFNKKTGLWVKNDNLEYLKSTVHQKNNDFTTNPYDINNAIKLAIDENKVNDRNTGWKFLKEGYKTTKQKTEEQKEQQKQAFELYQKEANERARMAFEEKEDSDVEEIRVKPKPEQPKQGIRKK